VARRGEGVMKLASVFSYLFIGLLVLLVLGGCGSQVTGEFVESEVSFQTEDSELSGTLLVPEGDGLFPAVIILGGSGPWDRNGDEDARRVAALQQAGQPVFAVNSTYRDIAEELSREGMITLRYDKRGIGNSTGDGGDFPEPSLRDLRAAVEFLRGNDTVDADRIAIIGHSLGGLWALMETAEDADIAAICVMATPAREYSEVIVEQIEGLMTLQGKNDTEIAAIVAKQREIYAQLRSGELDPAIFPEPTRSELEFLKAIMDIAGADYAGEIGCPALILQGDKDLFTVIPEEAEVMKEAFNEGGNGDVEMVIFTDLDHVFRPTPGDPSLDLYYEDRGPVAAEVVETIVDWMKAALR
jgi:dipeptidyl aminopeptidase/acylaminoacyl peptidase